MFPSVIPEYIRQDPYREAEVWIYERLQEDLGADWRCYYSRPWIGLTSTGEEKDGEADFVVAHADYGFLTIEVKGGKVWREEGSEQWFSRNRLKITNKIKDPVKQAHDSKHELLRQLKEQPGWRHQYITARHGVVLTDSGEPDRVLGPNMPRFLFAFAEDCKWLGAWVIARLSRHGENSDAPGRGLETAGMEVLHELLAGRIEFRTSLRRVLHSDRREVERLTREQFDVLTSIEDHPQMAISGGAGTGKTLLALEKACRTAEAGKRTLLVCFNAPLGEYLKRLTAEVDGITAGGFHSICSRLSSAKRHAGVPDRTWFDRTLPEALADAVALNPAMAFDAIIVDEGQDFRDGWLTALRLCLRDPEAGAFYVFYDDNQRVYHRDGGWLADLPQSRFHLTRNLRNTRSIHDSSRPWYASPRVSRAGGPEGQPVVWKAIGPQQSLESLLATTLADLMDQHGVKPGEIAILTPAPATNHPIARSGRIGGVPFSPAGADADGELIFDSVRRFKGMDRPVVLIIDADQLTDPEITYVALTRPSLLLKVFGSAATLARLRAGPAV
jgi:hypothetical protein